MALRPASACGRLGAPPRRGRASADYLVRVIESGEPGSTAEVISGAAVMPRMFVVVPVMVAIPIAFAGLDDAGRCESNQPQNETHFRDAQRGDHQILSHLRVQRAWSAERRTAHPQRNILIRDDLAVKNADKAAAVGGSERLPAKIATVGWNEVGMSSEPA
jgi:hypothetical protein